MWTLETKYILIVMMNPDVIFVEVIELCVF